MPRISQFAIAFIVLGAALASQHPLQAQDKKDANAFQYQFETITVPPATADEPKRDTLSIKAALDYLDQGALAWNGSRKCVTCHTNGTYMSIRPALTPWAGPPNADLRKFFITSLQALAAKPREELLKSTVPAQVIYIAAGLAEWDARVTKQLSPETEQALVLMFGLQLDTGTWGALDCWPPFESSAFQEATVAAMAVGTAPGWLANLKDEKLRVGVDRLRSYLRTQPPAQDYDKALLLWASARLPGVLDEAKKQDLIEMVSRHQRPDGGWSVRTFAAPEQWGRGNRAEKLKGEPEFQNPPSDGHQTGLAIILLREAGVPADDARLQRGVQWIRNNQRVSGRWWTRSLNTEKWHFITYSGTAYPLLALSLCNAVPATETSASK